MILRRYGATYESVDTNFDARALTEIGFRRNRELSIPTADFESGYARVSGEELAPQSEGPVQDEAEQAVLEQLQERVDALVSGLGDGEVLVVENEQGVDWPKTRGTQRGVVVDGQNRFHFENRVEPALRVAVYRKNG